MSTYKPYPVSILTSDEYVAGPKCREGDILPDGIALSSSPGKLSVIVLPGHLSEGKYWIVRGGAR